MYLLETSHQTRRLNDYLGMNWYNNSRSLYSSLSQGTFDQTSDPQAAVISKS